MSHTILQGSRAYEELDQKIKEMGAKNILLVCGNSAEKLPNRGYFTEMPDRLGITLTEFRGFTPNPDYKDCMAGAKSAADKKTDLVIALGGGSAMDVAKCISLWADDSSALPLVAIPTTAGTGSEETRSAVIYKDGEKMSVSDERLLPQIVLLDGTLIKSLPPYQRSATMMDAFCHAIESFLSLNGTDASRSYAMNAIHGIMMHIVGYLDNREEDNEAMLRIANCAGMAINISKTTAGHAMCYKLTTKYGLAHGHAAALCVAALWSYMKKQCAQHPELCQLKGGAPELKERFELLEGECKARDFEQILLRLGLFKPEVKLTEEDLEELASSVNPDRLGNNPMKMSREDLKNVYRDIFA